MSSLVLQPAISQAQTGTTNTLTPSLFLWNGKAEQTDEGRRMETPRKTSTIQGKLCQQNLLNFYITQQMFQSPIPTLKKAVEFMLFC